MKLVSAKPLSLSTSRGPGCQGAVGQSLALMVWTQQFLAVVVEAICPGVGNGGRAACVAWHPSNT